jgi:hypothetical protein
VKKMNRFSFLLGIVWMATTTPASFGLSLQQQKNGVVVNNNNDNNNQQRDNVQSSTPPSRRQFLQTTTSTVAVTAASILASYPNSAVAADTGLPLQGAKAPDFELPNSRGTGLTSLTALTKSGKWTVLYFYPGAFTR